MNALKTLIPAVALAAGLALSASADAATTVTIGLSNDNGATIAPVATGVTSANVNTLAFGPWEVTADAHVGFFPDLLNTNTFDAKNTAGGGTLDIFVTVQGLTNVSPGFLSGFTENLLSNGWSVTETTYYSTTNGLFLTGATQLSTATFNATGATTATAPGSAGPSPYSVTERFHIVAAGIGNAQSTIDVTAIPEPTTWALMIFGFGGVGAMLRRRRTAVAFA